MTLSRLLTPGFPGACTLDARSREKREIGCLLRTRRFACRGIVARVVASLLYTCLGIVRCTSSVTPELFRALVWGYLRDHDCHSRIRVNPAER
jgi:hypothetical protein